MCHAQNYASAAEENEGLLNFCHVFPRREGTLYKFVERQRTISNNGAGARLTFGWSFIKETKLDYECSRHFESIFKVGADVLVSG